MATTVVDPEPEGLEILPTSQSHITSNDFLPMSPRSSIPSLLCARLLSWWCTRLLSQKNLRLSLRYCDSNFFQSCNIFVTTTLLWHTKWWSRVSFTSCTDIASTSLTRRSNLDSSTYRCVHLLIVFCVIYRHSKVFMVQASRLFNLICSPRVFQGVPGLFCLCLRIFLSDTQ